MLAIALCVTAVIYLYGAPIVRCCRHRKARPVSAELIDEFKDL